MRIYNSLTRQIEEFTPINGNKVGIYTCGPTVYSFPTIGNFRTYTFADFLVRALIYKGMSITYIMNLTDVGHLTGDNEGDADSGEDRLEKAATREGKTAWDIAKFYSDDFLDSFDKLNLLKPQVFCRATDHIQEQIDMIQKIEKRGFTYKIDDGIYFDVQEYEKNGNSYGELSNLDKVNISRIEPNPQKRDPRDFALWKFSPKNTKRDMEWNSPWGVGFPGWHIECSAMSIKYLGDQFDIHIGGEDLKSTHHPNEIAQAESATNKRPFVKYWMHGAFLTVDGKRMGKSLGNAYTLHDIEKKGFDIISLRYFYATGNYRKPLNFTWEALTASQNALTKLRNFVNIYKASGERTILSNEKLEKVDEFRKKFDLAISDDLNLPEALSILWEVVKSNIPDYDKYDLIMEFDSVLGFDLGKEQKQMPENVKELLLKRAELRKEGKFDEADKIRDEVLRLGFKVSD